jgi:hypothetical protein
LFRIKKPKLLISSLNIVWAKGVGGVRGVWKVRVRAVDFKQGTSVLQVSGFFLLQHKGFRLNINWSCSCMKHKNRILSVLVKNKPCVVYIVMCLILWKRSHGSKTVIPTGLLFLLSKCKYMFPKQILEYFSSTILKHLSPIPHKILQ